MNIAKNNTIKETRRKTRERRLSQQCKVYECKVDKSHLSKKVKEYLKRLFLEAKWFSNDVIGSEGIFEYDYKKKKVIVFNKKREEEWRDIKNLTAQMRQSLVVRIRQDVINLAKKREKGQKIGKLQFKNNVNCIPLNQKNVTHKIIDKNHIKIQGCREKIRVSGLEQIRKEYEVAKADLVNKNGNYYVKIVCFEEKEEKKETGRMVGLDFGIETNVTTSEGEKFKIDERETVRLKRLQRGMHKRMEKGSKNWVKRKEKIGKEYEKIRNKRKDQRNKIVSYLMKKYDVVVCQDENIKGWHSGLFGKQVQNSAMGGIMTDLRHKSATFVGVSKWFPSTKLCDECGNEQEVGLDERVYVCRSCGNRKDRDVHSAINIMREGLRELAMRNAEQGKTPVELETTTCQGRQCKSLTMNQEAILF